LFSLWIKRLGFEAGYSRPWIAAVKNTRSYTSTPPLSLYGVMLNSAEARL
jgi:hypothetical protein